MFLRNDLAGDVELAHGEFTSFQLRTSADERQWRWSLIRLNSRLTKLGNEILNVKSKVGEREEAPGLCNQGLTEGSEAGMREVVFA